MTSRGVYTRVPTNKWVHCHGCAGSRWQGLSVSLKSPGLLLNTMQVNGACLFIVELSPGHSMTIAVLNQQWAVITHRIPHHHPRQLGLKSRKGEGSFFCFTELQANTVGAGVRRSGSLLARGLQWALAHQPGLVCWECPAWAKCFFALSRGKQSTNTRGEPKVIVLMSVSIWQWLSELPECKSVICLSLP